MRYLVTVLLVFLLTGITTLSASANGGHGCAQPVPPAIPGSPSSAPTVAEIIVINEVLLVPHSTWNCSETSGTFFVNNDSWLELYNTQNQPYNLYAAHAAIDSGPTTNPYYLPFGAAIPAHGFLVLFPRTNSLFVATQTTTLRLTIGSVVIDQVNVPQLGPDQSYARTSDGASSWQITSTPTIDASNTALQVTATATVGGSQGKGSTGSGIYTGTSTANNSQAKALAIGTQPTWNKLQLPPTATANVTDTPTVTPTTLSSSSSPASGGLDLARRIALSLLCVALALTLWWCWRLFTSA